MIWDGCASLAVADAAGADFVRVEHAYVGAEVTSAGILQGQCAKITQLKRKLGSKMPIYVDVYEPHAVQICPKPVEDAAFDAVRQCFADGLFLCGRNAQESLEMVGRARARVGDTPSSSAAGRRATTFTSCYSSLTGCAWARGSRTATCSIP